MTALPSYRTYVQPNLTAVELLLEVMRTETPIDYVTGRDMIERGYMKLDGKAFRMPLEEVTIPKEGLMLVLTVEPAKIFHLFPPPT